MTTTKPSNNQTNGAKLSIIIPAYNEAETIEALLQEIYKQSFGHQIELIIVDDGSTDGTRDILNQYRHEHVVIFHEKNQGKGAAIRTGIGSVTGSHVVIQDADLEYDPKDLVMMWDKMREEELAVLYGSRSIHRGRNKEAGFTFYWGGQLVTLLTNVLYFQKLTDEPTCYKMFTTDLLTSLPLTCNRFEFCPEVTALVAKLGYTIQEVPVSYYPRTAAEGKKINWKDGVEALWTLVKNRLW
jgi:glycosyltransferase involved in cell wall biosynthesis